MANSVEVVNVSPFGFWIFAHDRELFLPFAKFPWFKNATIDEICDVEIHGHDHFHWPKLDIDLDLDRIEHPDRYPLVSQS